MAEGAVVDGGDQTGLGNREQAHAPRDTPTDDSSAVAPTPRAVADATLAGWFALIGLNLVLSYRIQVDLSFGQLIVHRLYDAGQLLALGAVSWLATWFVYRLSLGRRLVVALLLLGTLHYLLIPGDLENFLERHAETQIPWRPLFATVTTLAVVGSYVLGLWSARNWARFATLPGGFVLAISNHFVLTHDYPWMHLVVAWVSATFIGTSLLPWVSRLHLAPRVRKSFAALSVVSLLSYLTVPGPTVRVALLRSAGSVAAPFAATAWAKLGRHFAPNHTQISAWFKPRHDLPPVPATTLAGAPSKPIIVLLTVDAVRSDVLEGPKVDDKMVPHLLEMREHSLRFERVWAGSSYTQASLRALFAGAHYLQHPGPKAEKLRKEQGQRVEWVPRAYLADVLEQHGVATVNLLTHKALGQDGTICRGFGKEVKLTKHAPSEEVVAEVLKQLDAQPRGPFFMYSHILDPHAPYNRGGTKGSQKERYLAEVSVVDAAIGKLRHGIRERNLQDRTYLFVTSDHGEAFGEHGHYFHATTLYEEMIRIPMFLEGPGIEPRMVPRAVSLIDLGPTILSLFGIDTPGYFMGESLVAFMHGEDPMLTRPIAIDTGKGLRAMLFENRYKAMVDLRRGTEELYDLLKDPSERHNLVARADAQKYLDRMETFFAGMNPPAAKKK